MAPAQIIIGPMKRPTPSSHISSPSHKMIIPPMNSADMMT
jgi:hypothetical protein